MPPLPEAKISFHLTQTLLSKGWDEASKKLLELSRGEQIKFPGTVGKVNGLDLTPELRTL